MAEAGTLCTNADVLKQVGEDANSTYTAEAYTNVYIKEAEGEVCLAAKYDFVTNYASLSTIGKEFLRKLCSALAGFDCIKADPADHAQLNAAQTKLNALSDIGARGILDVQRKDKVNFIVNGS